MKGLRQELQRIWIEHCADLEFSNNFKTIKELKSSRMVLRSMGEEIGLIKEGENFDSSDLLRQIFEIKEFLENN